MVHLAVRAQLPVDGLGLILGNVLAGSIFFFSQSQESYAPSVTQKPDLAETFPSAFPACIITCAQSKKFEDVVDISN